MAAIGFEPTTKEKVNRDVALVLGVNKIMLYSYNLRRN